MTAILVTAAVPVMAQAPASASHAIVPVVHAVMWIRATAAILAVATQHATAPGPVEEAPPAKAQPLVCPIRVLVAVLAMILPHVTTVRPVEVRRLAMAQSLVVEMRVVMMRAHAMALLPA